MMKPLYCSLLYTFNEHFQQENLDFNFSCEPSNKDPSNFILMESLVQDGQKINARDMEDRGIHIHVDLDTAANLITIKGYDITCDDFETYLSENGIDSDPWPNPQTHIFYSWSDLWQIYDEQNNMADNSSETE